MGKTKHGRTSSELTRTYGGESSGVVLSTPPPARPPRWAFRFSCVLVVRPPAKVVPFLGLHSSCVRGFASLPCQVA